MKQKEIRAYLKKVKRYCPRSFWKKLAPELEGNLLDFQERNPDCTIAEIIGHFGAPETFGYSYILAMEDGERRKMIRQSQRTKRIVLAVAIAGVLTVAAEVIWFVHRNSENAVRSYEVWIEYDNTGEKERVNEGLITVETWEKENGVDKK